MRAKYLHPETKKQLGSDLVIIPTDDDRLKIIIIPIDIINSFDSQTSKSLTLLT